MHSDIPLPCKLGVVKLECASELSGGEALVKTQMAGPNS